MDLKTYRVTLSETRETLDFQADSMKTTSAGLTISRKDESGTDQQVAFFSAGTYASCWEVGD